jgi:hypothetical protein
MLDFKHPRKRYIYSFYDYLSPSHAHTSSELRLRGEDESSDNWTRSYTYIMRAYIHARNTAARRQHTAAREGDETPFVKLRSCGEW